MKNEAAEILAGFNKLISLEDLIYQVRDNEGLGWNGPKVLEWAGLCVRMQKLLKESHETSTRLKSRFTR
jgi:hypothetical protein